MATDKSLFIQKPCKQNHLKIKKPYLLIINVSDKLYTNAPSHFLSSFHSSRLKGNLSGGLLPASHLRGHIHNNKSVILALHGESAKRRRAKWEVVWKIIPRYVQSVTCAQGGFSLKTESLRGLFYSHLPPEPIKGSLLVCENWVKITVFTQIIVTLYIYLFIFFLNFSIFLKKKERKRKHTQIIQQIIW